MRAIYFVCVSLFIALLTLTTASSQEQKLIITQNSDYFGFDLLTQKDVSLDECKAICLKSLACRAFTYNQSAKFCFLKSDFRKLNPFPGAIAGRVVDINREPDIGAPPKLSFVQESFFKNADKFKASIISSKKLYTEAGRESLLNIAEANFNDSKFKIAAEKYSAALHVTPDDSKIWLSLSDAAFRYRPVKSAQKRFFRGIGFSAALNAYRTSRTKTRRAATLIKVGKGLELFGQYRNAMKAYNTSLSLRDSAFVKHTLTNLRILHGFRVLNHTVDADSRDPRICVQFSESLNKNGYEKFVRVNGQPPKAIEVKDKQICVEGLRHSRSYKITLRHGLPAAIDEALISDVDLNIYIRDRSPTVRFSGNNFVLPYAGRRGIPLISVNSTKAEMELFRVGERSLSQLLRGSKFLSQLYSYQFNTIEHNLGSPVWKGTAEIKPDLNREVVTSLSIDEALSARQPGVYVLSARTKGSKESQVATQWFVISDIGLTIFSGSKEMQIFTRSLSSAKPLAGVEVVLMARNNEVLGRSKTNGDGAAVFDAGLTRGKGGLAPALITAKQGGDDFVFLDISKPGFDFSDRGVSGRDVPRGVDVYAWSERGIYRVGETVHLAALARDRQANAINNLPLTFIFSRPDGEEYRRIVENGTSLGGYAVDLPLMDNAMRGTWQVGIYTDPKSEPIAEQRFLVEDFTPERTDFTLSPKQDFLTLGKTLNVEVEGRFLYGAPAANLALEGEVVLRTIREREGHKGYFFGLSSDDEETTQRFPLKNIPVLDEKGKTTIPVGLGEVAKTTRPRVANLVVRMLETSGRAVERSTNIKVVALDNMIGVKPLFDELQVGENSSAEFEVIAVEPSGSKASLDAVSWSLIKIERHYQWYRNASSWRYEAVDIESKIANGELRLNKQQSAKISTLVQWGRYRLDLETDDINGPATSIVFNAGWSVEAKSTDTPDGLEISLDKVSYKAGDVAQLKISPRFEGELLLAIGTDTILSTRTVQVSSKGAVVEIPVMEDWGAGVYILATLYRPADVKTSRMPMRAIGVKWLSVDPQNRNLSVQLDVPKKTKPNQPLSIPVSITNLEAGEEAYVMVAVVDEGILNLTGYVAPNPVARYFGQRKLGMTMRDIYGRLIDGSQGAVGHLRTGGDGVDGMSASGNAPTQKLLAFFEGPVRVDENGKALVSFDIPQFNGSVQIMATAWSETGVGSITADVVIREPIVVVASLPKFMAPGDSAQLLLEITNLDAPEGTYTLEVENNDNIDLLMQTVGKRHELLKDKKIVLAIPLAAKNSGLASASIKVFDGSGVLVESDYSVQIRPGVLPVSEKIEVSLSANGGSLVIDENLLGGSQLDGAKINIGVAYPNTFDVASLLLSLNQYPYGCAEQTTSKALPLLYASDFSGGIPGVSEAAIKKKIQKAIHRVIGYQSSTGGFSLWGGQRDDLWLGAYVTDFLTRALEKGYSVPSHPMNQALASLQNTLAYKNNLEDNDDAIAYALYVLARNRKASAGDLRYYSDTRLKEFKSPISRSHLAAGLALYGDNKRAEATFKSAYQLASQSKRPINASYTYGSRLRDASAMYTLAGESRSSSSLTRGMADLVSSLKNGSKYNSTQEQAWMLLAARTEKAQNDKITLNVNGSAHSGMFSRHVKGGELEEYPVAITNQGPENLRATVTTFAVPSTPLPAGGNGLSIKRTYYGLDGIEANVSEAKQNERFVVVIVVEQLHDEPSRLIVTDLLPAGFEIDNPRIVSSAQLSKFSWLPQTDAVHLEFLDDRFVAAYDHLNGGKSQFTVAYMVRAVTPGTFTHPAAQVEDMYRPQYSARTAAGWMQVKNP